MGAASRRRPEGGGITRLERSYLSDFRQEETPYTNKCIRNVFLDGEGRLWLDYCGLERLVNGISVFQFDGYEFHPVEFFSPKSSGWNG
ncbi:MAG: hypothetical protein H6566_15845 [Lewinellaceae bacterium]|nr:hypothetical protein [Lewinellaceae bacterium]